MQSCKSALDDDNTRLLLMWFVCMIKIVIEQNGVSFSSYEMHFYSLQPLSNDTDR